jgi:hypothetical protein
MSKKATATDAQLILQLYDLRREPEMRKARQWWLVGFWPENLDDYLNVSQSLGTPENNWLRQVSSYWSMASAFVLNGALNAELFLQPAISGEMVFVLAKVQPFLKQLRERQNDPQAYKNIETVINSSKFGRERLKLTQQRIKAIRERRAAAKTS